MIDENNELSDNSFVRNSQHDKYVKWLDNLKLFHCCAVVIGQRGAGKSASTIYYREEKGGFRYEKTVAYIKLWAKSNSAQVFSQIYESVCNIEWTGRSKLKQDEVVKRIRSIGIKLLIVDNAENLTRDALLDIRHLYEEAEISIVLIGTENLNKILKKHDLQVYFSRNFQFAYWKNPEIEQHIPKED